MGERGSCLSCVSTWSPPEPQPKVPAGPAEGQDTNSGVAAFLRDRPHATSRETAEEIGKSDQRVRTTSAWKEHRKKLREQRQKPEVHTRPLTPAMLAVIDSKDRDPAEIAAERELQETQRSRSRYSNGSTWKGLTDSRKLRFYKLSPADKEHEVRAWHLTGERGD